MGSGGLCARRSGSVAGRGGWGCLSETLRFGKDGERNGNRDRDEVVILW